MMRPALCDKLPASQSIFQCFRRQYHNLDYIVKIFDKSKVRLRNKLFFLRALILPADERSFQIGAQHFSPRQQAMVFLFGFCGNARHRWEML